MRRMIVGIIFVTIGLGFNGCTSIYSNDCLKSINSYSDARKAIKSGMTMSQVQAKWGRPNNKTSYNGISTWTYSEANMSEQTFKNALYQGMTGSAVMDTKVVQVIFNQKGRVKNIRYLENKN